MVIPFYKLSTKSMLYHGQEFSPDTACFLFADKSVGDKRWFGEFAACSLVIDINPIVGMRPFTDIRSVANISPVTDIRLLIAATSIGAFAIKHLVLKNMINYDGAIQYIIVF